MPRPQLRSGRNTPQEYLWCVRIRAGPQLQTRLYTLSVRTQPSDKTEYRAGAQGREGALLDAFLARWHWPNAVDDTDTERYREAIQEPVRLPRHGDDPWLCDNLNRDILDGDPASAAIMASGDPHREYGTRMWPYLY